MPSARGSARSWGPGGIGSKRPGAHRRGWAQRCCARPAYGTTRGFQEVLVSTHALARVLLALGALLTLYLLFAYAIIPAAWRRAEARHPALNGAPRLTNTSAGIPGDPLNIVLVATREQAIGALLEAGYRPADPITFKSSVRIAKSTLLHRPYDDAPVSNLLLFGRKQDLAFEQEVGHDARERHHVRFWRSAELDREARQAWFGAATFDRSVGLSRTTGQVTHHISPDVDAERDKIIADLLRANEVDELGWIDAFQDRAEGRNGGGDLYRTDRRLAVVVLRREQASPAP